MESKLLTIPPAQGELLLSRAGAPPEVPMDSILKRRSLLGAINLMIDASGMEDKELYVPLGIDAGHWSKMRKGQAQFPTDERLNRAMDLCGGSDIPLIWFAHSRGRGLYVLETETERQLRVERAKRLQAEEKVRVLQEAISGRFSGPP